VIKSYALGAPAGGETQVVTRADYRQRALKVPISLGKNGSVFSRVTVGKDATLIGVIGSRDSPHAIFVINIVQIAGDIHGVVFAITFRFGVWPN
jgi:hypothetical protein